MNCLECRKPLEKGKYCSERCGSNYRVRMHRLKVSSDLVPEEEGVESLEMGPKVTQMAQETLKDLPEGHADRNTLRDPNPDWAPDKIITDNNRTMTCPICGKLSLTHKRIEDGGTGACLPYMGRISTLL